MHINGQLYANCTCMRSARPTLNCVHPGALMEAIYHRWIASASVQSPEPAAGFP